MMCSFRLWLLVTTIHAVASVVKRAAPGLEPGRVPRRLWCSCGSAGQAPDPVSLTVGEELGRWELDRAAMASAGDRLCAGHDRDEPTASTGALVLGDDSLEGEGGGGGGGVGHDVFLSVVVVDTSIHTVAGIVKRAAPGLEPGCLP